MHVWIGTVLRAAVLLGLAQSSPHPRFEVASVRPTNGAVENQSTNFHVDAAQVRLVSLPLKYYIGMAYEIKPGQILGPDWINSERYDIQATIPPGNSRDQLPQMLQSLLEDRFGMKIHRETRDFPVYALVLGKAPLKVKEAQPDESGAPAPVNGAASGSVNGISVNLGNGSSWSFVPNRFEVHRLSMDVFVSCLERFADRPIVNMTGLPGRYDFGFDVNPEDYQPMMIRNTIAVGISVGPQALKALENSSSAALSDALEKIGLKLEPRKAPLDVIVLDDVRRTPTEN